MRKERSVISPEKFGDVLKSADLSEARVGFAMFIEASLTSPNSEVGQASQVATYCRNNEFNPLSLGKELLSQQSLVWRVQNIAVKTHIQVGRGPLDLKATKVRDVITRVFRLSHQLLVLDQQEVDYIAGELLPEYRKPDSEDPRSDEERLRRKVDQMLKAKGVVPFI